MVGLAMLRGASLSSSSSAAATARLLSTTAAAAGAGGGRAAVITGGRLSAAAGRRMLRPQQHLVQQYQSQHAFGSRAFSSGGGSGGGDFLGQPLDVDPFPFNSVLIDTDNMRVTDTSDFTTRLLLTIKKLREEGKTAIWVRVHALNGHLLGVLGTFGFRMHHCEPEYVMLNMWLRPGENKIPPFATHLVGVAGFVLNQRKEVLLVKEGSKQVSGWKLPGGYVNLGEEFGAAACREVEEETGVKTRFRSLLSIRHQHNVSFGRSDIYVVCRLSALTDEIRVCPTEIEDARWVPFAQFQQEASHPILKTVAQLTAGLDLSKDDEGGAAGPGDIVETEQPSILPNRPNYKLYHTALPK